MKRKIFYLLTGAILILSLVSMADAQQPDGAFSSPGMGHEDLPRAQVLASTGVTGGPTRTDTSWSDTFGDDDGLAWMENTAVVNGDVVLSQIEPLKLVPDQEEIMALTEGPDGKIYLGTSSAHLRVYDPATGNMTDLGAPVPDECSG